MAQPPDDPSSEDPLEYDPFVEATKARARRREEISVDIEIDSGEHARVNTNAAGEVVAPPPPPPDGDYNPFEGATSVRGVNAAASLFNEAERPSGLDASALFGPEVSPAPGGTSTRVVPKQRDATLVQSRGANATETFDTSQGETKVVETSTRVVGAPAPLGERTTIARPDAPPLKIDFSEVLGHGHGAQVAGAQRIGAQSLESGEFLSRYDKEAIDRAQAAPQWDMPNTLDREAQGGAVRVVDRRRGRVFLRVMLLIFVPALVAVGGVFIYFHLHSANSQKDLEALKKADAIHKKAAEEHEKEMAR